MAVEVDVEDARRLSEEMVVHGQDLEASGLQLSDDRIDFGVEERQIAHRDRLVGRRGLLEGGPRAERERGLDGNAVHRHAQVRSGPSEPVDVAGHVLARLPEDPVHGVPASRLRLSGGRQRQEHRCRDPEPSHVLLLLLGAGLFRRNDS